MSARVEDGGGGGGAGDGGDSSSSADSVGADAVSTFGMPELSPLLTLLDELLGHSAPIAPLPPPADGDDESGAATWDLAAAEELRHRFL
eukprot:CAMPEP_0203823176 /NCGR_PEP_ID=MMETSP0115-20131106/48461_1 /ASSEMBLY_ACC=CAM_ASM_000227 /TAXON_ID=33651 /ORGANISM="Bicosoecid sp, Strain ms1" /LENGTH=88 /DNA_ID=CAMNT_0050732209 /DNA_START=41 /DNA_END=303 /DNA_ORIENTATION=+